MRRIEIDFAWRHGGHIGVKKDPVGTCGDRTLYSWAKFLNMFQEICIAADHEKENDKLSLFNIFKHF